MNSDLPTLKYTYKKDKARERSHENIESRPENCFKRILSARGTWYESVEVSKCNDRSVSTSTDVKI